MADLASPASPPSPGPADPHDHFQEGPSGLHVLVDRLGVLEPTCMVVVIVEPQRKTPADPRFDPAAEPALTAMVLERLRDCLRDYDRLEVLGPGRYLMTLQTLAGADALSGLLRRIYLSVGRPYLLGPRSVEVRASVAAAIRSPNEEPFEYLQRLEHAIESARAAGCYGPVMAPAR